MPFGRLALLIAALVFLVTIVQLGVIGIALERLGLDERSAYLLLMTTLLGRRINVSMFSIEVQKSTEVGIGMPFLVAPLVASAVAMLLNSEQSAPLAYIVGTLGVLIDADLVRLDAIRQLGAPVAAIGGAGTFDGIFLTGVLAVLLAWMGQQSGASQLGATLAVPMPFGEYLPSTLNLMSSGGQYRACWSASRPRGHTAICMSFCRWQENSQQILGLTNALSRPNKCLLTLLQLAVAISATWSSPIGSARKSLVG